MSDKNYSDDVKRTFQISSDLECDVVNCWRILVKYLDVECLLESLTIARAHLTVDTEHLIS